MTTNELIQEMHRRIDRFALERIREAFPNSTFDKFFDVEAFAYAGAMHAIRLNEDLKSESRCLDLGCGFGYVALALECLGHSCVGWDNTAQVLRNVAIAIPIKTRIFQTINRCGIGNDFKNGYDLILLHGVFPMRDDKGWYDWPSYAGLIRKLLASLNPGGKLEIIANNGDQIPVCCDPRNWAELMTLDLSLNLSENTVIVRKESEVCAVSS